MTAAQLAACHGVSRLTALRALRILRDDGLLDFGRGRGIRIPHRPDTPVPGLRRTRTRSWERCAAAISEKINTGTWRAGTQLPKMSYFTETLHVSRTSVERALQRLADESVVYKSGKAWLAGPRVRRPSGRIPYNPPVVVLLQSHEEQWVDMYGKGEWQRFVDAFTTEAESYGVQLLPVMKGPSGNQRLFSVGRDQIARQIRVLGRRYLGTLLLPGTEPQGELEWWQYMCRFGKPVMRLYGPGVTYHNWRDPLALTCMVGRWGPLKYHGAAAVVADLLRSLGHERVDLPFFEDDDADVTEDTAYQMYRYGIYKQGQVGVHGPVLGERPHGRTLARLSSNGPGYARELLRVEGDGPLRRRWQRLTATERNLVRDSEVLRPLVESGATAIVAATDWIARRTFYWCRAAGVRIPRDISLVSFENTVAIKPYPITSIDLGQRRLGYKTFHYLFGHVPVKPTKYQQLWGGTSINHTASVGPPAVEE
jgi:DNA-binding transcriptional regulator YhcF (GntR family)